MRFTVDHDLDKQDLDLLVRSIAVAEDLDCADVLCPVEEPLEKSGDTAVDRAAETFATQLRRFFGLLGLVIPSFLTTQRRLAPSPNLLTVLGLGDALRARARTLLWLRRAGTQPDDPHVLASIVGLVPDAGKAAALTFAQVAVLGAVEQQLSEQLWPLSGVLQQPLIGGGVEHQWRLLAGTQTFYTADDPALPLFGQVERLAASCTRFAAHLKILLDLRAHGYQTCWFHVQADACPVCKRLYQKPDGTPRTFFIDDILAHVAIRGGVNAGPRRTWLPLPTAHPWCRCRPMAAMPGVR